MLINLDKLDLTRDSDAKWLTGVQLAGEDVDTGVKFPVHWMISGFREGGSEIILTPPLVTTTAPPHNPPSQPDFC